MVADAKHPVTTPGSLPQLLGRVRRRMRLQAALEWATTAAILAVNLAIVIIYLWKVGELDDDQGVLALMGSAGLIGLGAAFGAARSIPESLVAKKLDRASGLRDRIGTALAFQNILKKTPDAENGDFMRAAIADAVAHAGQAKPKAASPFRRPADLGALAAVTALCAGIVLIKIELAPPPPKEPPLHLATQNPTEKPGYDVDAVRNYVDAIQDTAEQDKDPELAALAKKINDLLDQLERGEITKKDMFEKLQALEEMHLHPPDAEQLKNDLADLKELGKDLEKEKLTAELGKALKESDLEKAKDEMKKLADLAQQNKLDDKQKKDLAKAFDKIADKQNKDDDKVKKDAEAEIKKLQDDIKKLEKKLEKNPKDEQAKADLEEKKRDLERLMKDKEAKDDEAKKQKFEDEIKKLEQAMQKCTPEELAKKGSQCSQMQDELAKKNAELAKQEKQAEDKKAAEKQARQDEIKKLEDKLKQAALDKKQPDEKTQAEREQQKRDLERLQRQDKDEQDREQQKQAEKQKSKWEDEVRKLEKAMKKCTPAELAKAGSDCKKQEEQLAEKKQQLKKLDKDQQDKKDEQKQAQKDQQQKLQNEKRSLEKKVQDNPKDQEAKRSLDKKKRELEKLERDQKKDEQADQKKKKRELQRLTRNMKDAAENLRNQKPEDAGENMKDSSDDLGKMEDEVRKLSSQKKAQEQMGDLKEALRRAQKKQGGEGGQQGGRKGKLRDFMARAKGQEGNGQQWTMTKDGQGVRLKPGLSRGSGAGQKPGDGSQPMPGQGDKPGMGQSGQGKEPGNGIGNEHDPNVMGNATHNNVKYADKDLDGAHGKGPSRSQVIQASAQKGFATRAYKKVYTDYTSIVEEVMNKEKVPLGYKYYIKRYFELIKPQE